MATTCAGEALMYLTNEAKPPASGLLRPEPKSPSMMNMSGPNCGGSNSSVTSIKLRMRLVSCSRFLLAVHSGESRPLMLNR